MSKNNDVYVKAVPGSADLPATVFQTELKAINDRRELLGLPPVEGKDGAGPSVAHGLVGIGLSGGGIRSSTFNLGLLQALDRAGLFQHADYLSTVSGGGYIGSCLSSIFAGGPPADQATEPSAFPFRHTPGQPESKAFKHLRDYASYLKPPRPLAGLRMPGLILKGLLVNFLIILPLILLLVVGTVLVARNDIRDALNTRQFQHTIARQAQKMPSDQASDPYRQITIDLRSQIRWGHHHDTMHVLVTGLANDEQIPGGVKSGDNGWILEKKTPQEIFFSLKHFNGLEVMAWPSENGAYDFFRNVAELLGGNTAWVCKLVKLVPALFEAQKYAVPAASKSQKQESGQRSSNRALQLNLGNYVGWKEYIVLSGLPNNAYSDCGKFLDKGRWLFDGAAAQDLRLKMWIPNLDQETTIDVRAWQTRDMDYLTMQKLKKRIDLQINDKSEWIANTWFGHDANNYRTQAVAKASLTEITIGRILEQCKFQWGDSKENQGKKNKNNRYLMIRNLPNEISPTTGQRLDENNWVFVNQQIEANNFILKKEWLKSQRTDKPLHIIAWQSGMDNDLFDPVMLIYSNTFNITKWLVLIFGCLLALSPLIQKMMKACGVAAWQRRDLLTRYLCGGGIAAVAIIAFLEMQPLAIYLFYRLKESLDVAGIIGGADKVFAVAGSIAAVAGGIFSSRAMGQGAKLNTKIGLYAMGVIGPGVLWLFYLNFCGWALNHDHIPTMLKGTAGYVLLLFLAIALVTYMVGWFFYNVNQTSIHPFYRDRLSKAFFFTLDKNNGRVQHNDGQKLQELATRHGPYHLINTTLNINGKGDANLQGRQADFFIFSREYVGSQVTGYCRTDVYEEKDKHMGLATAMAISAAAAAPNMGRMTQKSLTFIMALLNIRLGYWAQNPNIIHRKRGCAKVRPTYLIKEMLGLLNEKSRCLYVSDGGHLENLGLYELVRRRCKYIIIGDAEADKDMTFKGLADAIRMIRIDMGVTIDIDLDAIYRNGNGSRHFATGTIYYGEGQKGCLLYIKSSVSQDHNPYIEDYMARKEDFPHESTADQFFDETQFEAYRALGADVGEKVMADQMGQKFLNDVLASRPMRQPQGTA